MRVLVAAVWHLIYGVWGRHILADRLAWPADKRHDASENCDSLSMRGERAEQQANVETIFIKMTHFSAVN